MPIIKNTMYNKNFSNVGSNTNLISPKNININSGAKINKNQQKLVPTNLRTIEIPGSQILQAP